MKILVTGGAGFIGSHVVDLFVNAGHDVVVVDDLSTGRTSNLNPMAKLYQLDIRSPELREVFELERPEVVDHHAAQMDVRRSVADPIFDADVNIQGSIKVAQLAMQYDARKFIHISSGGAVYGEPVYLPCDEEHPVRPLCPYGASKYTFELYLYMFKELYNLDYSVIRYPNVYGPRQDPNGEAGVVAIFIGQMLAGKPVTINGSGEQVRDFVFVGDCARANLAVLAAGDGQAYNVGTGVGTSINALFETLLSVSGLAVTPRHGPRRPGDARHSYLDCRKIASDLGWRPEVTLRDGLALTWNYIRDRR